MLALAIAIAFSPIQGVQAASPFGPGSQPGTENLTYTVKAKAKAKGQGQSEGQGEGQGQEGQEQGPRPLRHGMYWDSKKRACAPK